MYSISKSVTATAVGFAVEEGLLSVETKVLEIFPEYRPKKADDLLERMTVYHLLTMTAGKDIGLFSNKAGTDWVKQFFDAKWASAPGEGWRYISENTFMLSAILYRVTGMSMVDYLMPRLFEPLGITRRPFWELNQDGIEAGGWGLYLTTEECAKFIFCYKNGGVFNGRQIIPEHWARQAVMNLRTAAASGMLRPIPWPETAIVSGETGYRTPIARTGCSLQFAMVFDDYDAVLVVTSNEMDEDKTRHCIWRHFPGVFVPATQTPPEPATQPEKLEFAALPDLPAMPRSSLEKHIEGRTVRFRRQKLLKLLGFTVSHVAVARVVHGDG
jgi:CubicO group peptidase (beta-lactamase class C family)